jgi:dTMP kinase
MTEPSAPSGRRGLFVTFEGTEGSGKSTQVRLLLERLRAEGYPTIENQEPGGTAIGKEIRRLLLDPAYGEMAPMTELLLMFASRTQAAHEVILPGLRAGAVIVSDRFTDSTLAYQGEAREIGFDTVLAAHRLALGALLPDLTICVCVDLETGLARARRRNQRGGSSQNEDRIDQHSLAFHRRVSEGYQKIARLEPQRFRLVDGEGDQHTVAQRVWAEVSPLLARVLRVTQ